MIQFKAASWYNACLENYRRFQVQSSASSDKGSQVEDEVKDHQGLMRDPGKLRPVSVDDTDLDGPMDSLKMGQNQSCSWNLIGKGSS